MQSVKGKILQKNDCLQKKKLWSVFSNLKFDLTSFPVHCSSVHVLLFLHKEKSDNNSQETDSIEYKSSNQLKANQLVDWEQDLKTSKYFQDRFYY